VYSYVGGRWLASQGTTRGRSTAVRSRDVPVSTGTAAGRRLGRCWSVCRGVGGASRGRSRGRWPRGRWRGAATCGRGRSAWSGLLPGWIPQFGPPVGAAAAWYLGCVARLDEGVSPRQDCRLAGDRVGRRGNLAALAALGLEGVFSARVVGAGKAAGHGERGRPASAWSRQQRRQPFPLLVGDLKSPAHSRLLPHYRHPTQTLPPIRETGPSGTAPS
jgi:hypothetical protein